MSRIVPAEELDLIEQVISEHPEGIGISVLEKALALHLPKALNRRTLHAHRFECVPSMNAS